MSKTNKFSVIIIMVFLIGELIGFMLGQTLQVFPDAFEACIIGIMISPIFGVIYLGLTIYSERKVK